VYEKAAGFGIFPKWVNRGEIIFREGIHDLAPIVEKHRVGGD
jgi:hypothetical protein